mgnify:CR=1 FL=1
MLRFFLLIAAILSLPACNFNLTPTFYIRDIQDVISDKKDIEIPIFIKLPASDVDSCNSEIGQVVGILSTYEIDATLQSCSSDENNLFATANVEFIASVVFSETSRVENFKGIVGLVIEEANDGVYFLNLQANPNLPRAISDIESALIFASLDASQVGFIITLNNDTRSAVTFNIYDSFVNGVATDYNTFELGPRSELEVRASDVGANLFFNRGWFGIGEFTNN